MSNAKRELEIQFSAKYGLRAKSIQRRIEVETKVKAPKPEKRTPKPRPRPPPLSKYRRKTANARERDRMREINDAFEALQKAIPGVDDRIKEEKCTKLNTLKLAMNYIKALSDILAVGPEERQPPSSPANSLSSNATTDSSRTGGSSSPLEDLLTPGEPKNVSSPSSNSEYFDSFSLDDLPAMPSLPDTFELLLTEEDFSLSTVMDEPNSYR